MKKLVILLVLFSMLFCSCSGELSESSFRTDESSSSSSVPLPPLKPNKDTSSENEAFSGSSFQNDPSVTYLGKADDMEIYKKAVQTGGTRPDIVYGRDGVFNTVTEVLETEYRIIDKDGSLLIEHLFYDLRFWEGDEIFEIEPYIYPGIGGCYQGNLYTYSFTDGKFKLTKFYEAGPIEPVPNFPEYIRTRYSYTNSQTHYGLNDKNGNVIFEPVFSYYITVPFEDWFIAGTNNVDLMNSREAYDALINEAGEILCMYANIHFISFDDGSYIGIAWYPGCGEDWGNFLYDENGELLEKGYRFIDKNGNELSPCFESELLISGGYEYVENHLDEIITAADENGNAVEFTGRDFICEP